MMYNFMTIRLYVLFYDIKNFDSNISYIKNAARVFFIALICEILGVVIFAYSRLCAQYFMDFGLRFQEHWIDAKTGL